MAHQHAFFWRGCIWWHLGPRLPTRSLLKGVCFTSSCSSSCHIKTIACKEEGEALSQVHCQEDGGYSGLWSSLMQTHQIEMSLSPPPPPLSLRQCKQTIWCICNKTLQCPWCLQVVFPIVWLSWGHLSNHWEWSLKWCFLVWFLIVALDEGKKQKTKVVEGKKQKTKLAKTCMKVWA